MLAHPDLLAFDARYHRSCYSHYISKRNIACAQRKAKDPFESAFADLTRFIDQTIFTNKSVATLVEVLSSFIKFLLEKGVKDAYRYKSWKLKDKLKAHYGDRLLFVHINGESNVVCSSELSVGTVISKVVALKKVKEDNEEEEHQLQVGGSIQMNDSQVLHTAAGTVSLNCEKERKYEKGQKGLQKGVKRS